MRISQALVCLYGISSSASAAALPDTSSLSLRTSLSQFASDVWPELVKRRGGGGSSGGSSSGGGGGGRGGSSSSSSGSSSGSGSSSSSSSSSGSGARGGSGSTSGASSGSRGSSTSNTGGSTTTGSGAPRTFGGGSYYGGGARTPLAPGARSASGILPILILTPALALGAIWAYGAYTYPYGRPYSFYNSSRRGNETLPVQCWCEQYNPCGCDGNNDTSYLSALVGNGTGLNQTLIRRVNLNGTDTLVINGTLPNGTTAPGGTESPDSVASSTSNPTMTGAGMRLNGWTSLPGYWMMFATVIGIVCSM